MVFCLFRIVERFGACLPGEHTVWTVAYCPLYSWKAFLCSDALLPRMRHHHPSSKLLSLAHPAANALLASALHCFDLFLFLPAWATLKSSFSISTNKQNAIDVFLSLLLPRPLPGAIDPMVQCLLRTMLRPHFYSMVLSPFAVDWWLVLAPPSPPLQGGEGFLAGGLPSDVGPRTHASNAGALLGHHILPVLTPFSPPSSLLCPVFTSEKKNLCPRPQLQPIIFSSLGSLCIKASFCFFVVFLIYFYPFFSSCSLCSGCHRLQQPPPSSAFPRLR